LHNFTSNSAAPLINIDKIESIRLSGHNGWATWFNKIFYENNTLLFEVVNPKYVNKYKYFVFLQELNAMQVNSKVF